MIVVSGDIHGSTARITLLCEELRLTEKDILILLGDVGANYFCDDRDKPIKEQLQKLAPTILCIHGNHEARPSAELGYILKTWHGGKVFYQPEYPKLLFARDGEIYSLAGLQCLAIGGAYSVDKYYRLARGWKYFEDEQPSVKTKQVVEQVIQKQNVDVIFSHTCPAKYIPVECFLSGIDQNTVDQSTEEWLDKIEETIDYTAWFSGHYHTNKQIERLHFLFDDYIVLNEFL